MTHYSNTPGLPRLRRGLTLAEVLISTMLVGMVVVASMRCVGGVLQTASAAENDREAQGIAEHLMAEILQQQYEEPDDTPVFGRESLELAGNRTLWDDVDDYHGWSSSPPESKTNNSLNGYTGWTRAVNVALADVSAPQNTSGTDEGLKRITVTVTDPEGRVTTLVAFRSSAGALQEPPQLDKTVQTWVGNRIQVDSLTKLRYGANLGNVAEDE